MQIIKTTARTRALRALRILRTFSIALMLAVVALTGCAPNNDNAALNAKTCARLGVSGPHLETCASVLPRVLNDRQKSGDVFQDTWANVKTCARLGITGSELSSCVGLMPNVLKERQSNGY